MPSEITDSALCPICVCCHAGSFAARRAAADAAGYRPSGQRYAFEAAQAAPRLGVWKDISALNQVQQELELTRDELRDTGDVLVWENAQRARWLKLIEENRLYDMMEAQTCPTDRNAAGICWLNCRRRKIPAEPDTCSGRSSSSVPYIKRRSNLIFVGVQRGAISVQELRLCLNESSENIIVYGADCKVQLSRGKASLPSSRQRRSTTCFEAVVETELESLRALLISIEVRKRVEVAIGVSAAESLCGLHTRFPDLEWEQDEDGLQYVTRKLERSRR